MPDLAQRIWILNRTSIGLGIQPHFISLKLQLATHPHTKSSAVLGPRTRLGWVEARGSAAVNDDLKLKGILMRAHAGTDWLAAERISHVKHNTSTY